MERDEKKHKKAIKGKFGLRLGWYDTKEDVVHYISGEVQEFYTREHERVHRERRNAITFRYSAINPCYILTVVLSLLSVFAVISYFTFLPFWSSMLAPTIIMVLYFFSEIYEEYKAEKLASKRTIEKFGEIENERENPRYLIWR